jgi:hypothetical protein
LSIDHFHPFLDAKVGNDFDLFPAPEPEDYLAATNSFLRVILKATDSNGLSNTIIRDIMPNIVMVNIHTEPKGLDVVVDDYKIQSPDSITSWRNYDLPLYAEDQPPYLFKSWSDGEQNRTRVISLVSDISSNTVVTAQFCLDFINNCTMNKECCSENCEGKPYL